MQSDSRQIKCKLGRENYEFVNDTAIIVRIKYMCKISFSY